MNSKLSSGFTLVELIVVITILAILGTIGFISFLGYQKSARESMRISDVRTIERALWIFQVQNSSLPLPDNYITLTSSWTTVGYQWDIGSEFMIALRQGADIRDPLDGSLYTIALNSGRTHFQILAFMEDIASSNVNLTSSLWMNLVYANERYPRVFRSSQPSGVILLDATNIPLQNTISWDFDLQDNLQTLRLIYANWQSIEASWYAAWAFAQTQLWISNPRLVCPEGFVLVPWNPEFHAEDFCVAQYEMTYEDADEPNSPPASNWTTWNTVSYIPWKPIVSMAGKYPIANIRQQEAIDACIAIWEGFHLITNNQWMAIARNIESNPQNWSTWMVWNWFIWNWVSWDENIGCDLVWWNIEQGITATKTWPWIDLDCNQRRLYSISNGSVIWDFSWNLRQHVNKANTYSWEGFWDWVLVINWSSDDNGWDDDGIYDPVDMQRYGSALWLWNTHGMWSVFRAPSNPNAILVRWWHAWNNENAWIYTIHRHYNIWLQYSYLWFRCSYVPQ